MKPAVKIAVIAVGAIAAVLIGLTLFIKTSLSGDALRSVLLPRIEAYTGREAEIGDIRVSIFRSINVKDFHLKESDRRGDFIQAEKLVLRYRFWPILKRRLIIDELQLSTPVITVSRGPTGRFNFADIQEKLARGGAENPAPAPEAAKRPFTVTADRIEIRGAGFQFTDSLGRLPGISALADMDLGFSTPPTGASLAGRIELRSLRAAFPGGEAQTTGRIDIGESIAFHFDTRIGEELISLVGSVRDYWATPVARVDIASKELHLDRLAALSGPQAPAEVSPPASPPPVATVTGNVSIVLADYRGYRIRDLRLRYAYRNGAVQLSQVAGAFAGGGTASLSGTFGGGFTFSIGTADTIKRTLAGSASAELDTVRLKGSEISTQVAALLGIPELATMLYNRSEFHADFQGGTVALEGFMSSPKLKANPIQGTVSLVTNGLDLTVDLLLAPDLSARLPRPFRQVLASRQGWIAFPLAITGTTAKPSVGPNQDVLGSGIRRELEKQLRRGLQELIPGQEPGERQLKRSAEEILEGLLR